MKRATPFTVSCSFFMLLVLVVTTSGHAAGLPTLFALGQVEASPTEVQSSTAHTTSIVVTSTADSGSGTLRQALLDASPGDIITFDPAVFPPGAPATIAVTSGSLPALDDGHVTIDASSAGVILSGSALAGDENGLHISSDGNVVKGLQILGFPQDGIEIFEARDNVIGGSTPAERNVIGGNGQNGVRIGGTEASNNTVSGSYIGVDAAGSAALPNGESGVTIEDGASNNTIGGSAVEGNVIFSNLGSGVHIRSNGTENNTVAGNWIGLSLSSARQALVMDQALSPTYPSDCTHYVATYTTGIHKSTDCGVTWNEMNTGLPQASIMQIDIPPDATTADTVYALTDNGHLYRTANGGTSWSQVSTVLEGIDRRNLVLSASFTTDQTMVASAEGWVWDTLGGQPGVFKSVDAGVTWTRTVSGMGDIHVRKVIASADPAAAGVLFVLTQTGIEKSTDGGASWTAVASPDSDLNDLALSPAYAADQTLFVAASPSGIGRIYRSTNGGATWTGADTPRGDPRFLAVSPDYVHDHQVCHGGGWNDSVYCSTDGGASWTQADTKLPGWLPESGTGIAFSPDYATSGTVWIVSFGGMSHSTDRGATWDLSRGLHDLGNRNGVSIDNGASHNTIGPNNIISNNVDGVIISGNSAYNVVTGNRIGTDPTGAFAQANCNSGLSMRNGHHNIVGGASSGEGNLISANGWIGVSLEQSETMSNTVAGNFIGINAVATGSLPNRASGVGLWAGANHNVIGGQTPAERNVISGNNGEGVALWDAGTSYNTVLGNFIGTIVTGTVALGNMGSGVSLNGGASDNTIGGESPAERNIISGNHGNGVNLSSSGTSYNTIKGNVIGTNALTTAVVPNDNWGVMINSGASDNTIGGGTPADRNIISGNNWGVGIADSGTVSNVIQGNYIGTDASGSVDMGNTYEGVDIFNGAQSNTVVDNLLSGNNNNGVIIEGAGTSSNTVRGNSIGSDAAGGAALPNGANGVAIVNKANNNLVDGNLIGTDGSGTQPLPIDMPPEKADDSATLVAPLASWGLSCSPPEHYPPRLTASEAAPNEPRTGPPACTRVPSASGMPSAVPLNDQEQESVALSNDQQELRSNGGAGVYIAWDASDNMVGPNNTIAFNAGHGVHVQGGDTIQNRITHNSIFRNDGAGIALTDGGNSSLAAPRVTAVNLPAGTASGTACANCTVEVFSDDGEEGRTYEGSTTASAGGQWAFNAGHVLTGPNVTATAADAAGNTSPFSPPFNLLVFDLQVPNTLQALDRLGIAYTLVDATQFATVNLADYDVLFVGFTGNDPQPPDLLQPLLDRQSDIAAFVQNGGGLVVNSEDGVVATPLDWSWVPVPVTHRQAGGNRLDMPHPAHLLMQGITQGNLQAWPTFHNIFVSWTWPAAEILLSDAETGEAVLLAGNHGAGRMIFSGADPDYHGEPGAVQLLANELAWAAGVLTDTPPQVDRVLPQPNTATARQAIVKVTFSQLLDPATVTPGIITATGSTSGAHTGASQVVTTTAQVLFVPDIAFSPGEEVTVTVHAALEDLTGHGLDGNRNGISEGSPVDDVTWSFTVRAGQVLEVVTTANEGPGSLRQALQDAQPGDTITFNLPPVDDTQAATIVITGNPLPSLWQGYLTLNGEGVTLDGNELAWGSGLDITSDRNVVTGLRITGFPDSGITLRAGGTYNTIGGANATPGGVCGGDCNVLSGNHRWGLALGDTGTQFNRVRGNYIGTDAAGLAAWPNGEDGIRFDFGAEHNTIGGASPGERNLISGNRYRGLFIATARRNTIIGNFVGVDATGLAALPNQQGFHLFRGSDGNQIGGAAAGQGNVISGNPQGSVYISGSSQNWLQGNVIGLDAAGLGALGSNDGIRIFLGSDGPSVDNVIGGAAAGAGNVISGNDNGVIVQGAVNQRNTISRNSIYGNGNRGIDLNEGGNASIPPPVVVTLNPGAGTAAGTGCAGCTVEIFSDQDDEGQWVEGASVVNGTGHWSLAAGHSFTGPNVQATARDAAGNTSEFSGPAPIVNAVEPNSAAPGTDHLVVSIYGNQFRDDQPLTVSFGPGITVLSSTYHHAGHVDATITIDSGAGLGLRDVSVTNNDGQSSTATAAFEVVATTPFGPPVISDVSPSEVANIDQTIRLIVQGSAFVNLPVVSLTPAVPGLSIGSVWWGGNNRLEVELQVSAGAPLGPVGLTMTNPDHQSTTLPGTFSVVTPLFHDVAPAVGLDASSGEHGAAWGDWNGDGWLDLAIGNGSLFTSMAGIAFYDATAQAGLDSIWNHGGVAWGDYDNDGALDLLSSWRKVYHQSSLPFSKVWDGNGNQPSLAWVDYDQDGDLDVYASGRLYRTDDGGTFADVTGTSGLSDDGSLWAAVWADYDDDGDPDLYLTNSGGPNRLYRNNGDGTFDDVSDAAGVADSGSGHGAAWGDYDNDGDFDLFVANNDGQFSILYRNSGDGTFEDVSAAAGLRDRPGNATGANWLDYDLDGWLDLFVVNRNDQNRLYHNNGDGTFTDVAPGAGVADRRDSDGSTIGDYDNDGDPDIFVVSGIWGQGTPNFLFRNATDAGGAHWLKVYLQGVISNRTGIGARVRVYGGGLMITRQIAGSTGYMSQDAPEALFGLGSVAGPVVVEVTWPSGIVQTLPGQNVDQVLLVQEPPRDQKDMALFAINQPKGQAAQGSTIAPQATVRNQGALTESNVAARLVIALAGNPVYDQTVIVPVVESLRNAVVSFPDFTFATMGQYRFTFTTLLPGDQDPSNDQKVQLVQVSPSWVDVWTKDYVGDTGNVPTTDWWQSPDLWVRRQNDGGLLHQDPLAGVVNYVYVRVRNRGNVAASNVSVDTYWHGPAVGIICGDWNYIGSTTVSSLPAGGSSIVVTPWVPTRSGHTCLHDVVYNTADPVSSPCNVPGDNNIEQRNVEVLARPVRAGAGPSSIDNAIFQITNVFASPASVDVALTRGNFPLSGSMALELAPELFDRWFAATGGDVDGGQADPVSRTIVLTDPVSATVRGLPMYAEEQSTATLVLASSQAAAFSIEIAERIDGQAVGGSVYTGHTCRAEDVDCNDHVEIYDIQQVAEAWNTRVGDPGYDVWLDQNQDGAVTVLDIMLVTAAWAP